MAQQRLMDEFAVRALLLASHNNYRVMSRFLKPCTIPNPTQDHFSTPIGRLPSHLKFRRMKPLICSGTRAATLLSCHVFVRHTGFSTLRAGQGRSLLGRWQLDSSTLVDRSPGSVESRLYYLLLHIVQCLHYLCLS